MSYNVSVYDGGHYIVTTEYEEWIVPKAAVKTLFRFWLEDED